MLPETLQADAECHEAGVICVEGSCVILSRPIPITLEINEGDGFLMEGDTLQLTVTAYHPSGAVIQYDSSSLATMYTWTISEGDAATIVSDENEPGAAILTGTGEGFVTVKVTGMSGTDEVSYVFSPPYRTDKSVWCYTTKKPKI